MNGTLTPSTAAVLGAMFGALVIGSMIRLFVLRSDATPKAKARRASLRTWWILTVLMVLAVLAGSLGVCLLLAVASWMGFSEYRTLEAKDAAAQFASKLLRLTIPAVFLAIYLGWGGPALALLPLAAVLLVATSEIVHGVTGGYVRSIGALVFGAVVLIGGLGHAAEIVAGAARNTVGGQAGWFVFLIVLTEINDIAQALVGRQIGAHQITPNVSPHKTWEGLLGGIAVTMLTAAVLAPLLTPLTTQAAPAWTAFAWLAPWAWPMAAGLAISLAGFLGDLNISAVKRDAGVKDSSHALPGMGGVLDRVDSLTLTAPVFYWLVVVPTS